MSSEWRNRYKWWGDEHVSPFSFVQLCEHGCQSLQSGKLLGARVHSLIAFAEPPSESLLLNCGSGISLWQVDVSNGEYDVQH